MKPTFAPETCLPRFPFWLTQTLFLFRLGGNCPLAPGTIMLSARCMCPKTTLGLTEGARCNFYISVPSLFPSKICIFNFNRVYHRSIPRLITGEPKLGKHANVQEEEMSSHFKQDGKSFGVRQRWTNQSHT